MAVPNAAAGAGTPAENAAPPAPKVVTEEALTGILAEVVGKVRSDIKAEIGRDLKALKEAIGGAGKPAADKPSEDESPTEKTLRDRLANLEVREKSRQSGSVRSTIFGELVKAGADPIIAESMIPGILEREGERFIAKENKLGGFDVRFGEDSVTDWAKVFMSSDLGKKVAVATKVPSAAFPEGGSSGASLQGKRLVPKSQIDRLTDEDYKAGNIVFVDG